MAFPSMDSVEISFVGAGGKTRETTGPWSNKSVEQDSKPNLNMALMSPSSQISTAPPSPYLDSLNIDSPWSIAASPTLSYKMPSFDLDPVIECPSVILGTAPSVSQLENEDDTDFCHDVDSEGDIEDGVEKDGVTWTVTRGSPPSFSELEDHLSEVKSLYKKKFGHDVDSEDSDDEQSEYVVEEDGVTWNVTRGPPPSISQLESSLSDVKALYQAKFGHDVDSEDSDDEQCEYVAEKDGMTWTMTRGSPPSISQLESSLSGVKALYKSKFGHAVDSEDSDDSDDSEDSDDEQSEYVVDKDGVTWNVTRGPPPSISQLEYSLSDVKALYKAKFGQDVDSEDDTEDEVEKDGVMRIATRGSPPSFSELEVNLSEVKALYSAKFGHEVDSDSGTDAD